MSLDHRPDLDSRLERAVGVREMGRNLGSVAYGEPVFCLSCAKPDGYVTVDLPPGVFSLCGECETTFGVPAEMIARPDLNQATYQNGVN